MCGRLLALLLFTSSICADTEVFELNQTVLDQALQHGGVIRFRASGTIALTTQLIVRGEVHLDAGTNTVVLSGGAGVPIFYITNAIFSATGISFQDGLNTGLNSFLASVLSTNAPASGGALQITNSTVHLTNCVFRRNKSRGRSGQAYTLLASGGAIDSRASSLRFVSCRFEQNSSMGGPAITWREEFETYGLTAADAYGGAVSATGSLTIVDTAFIENYIDGPGSGGAIWTINSSMVVDRSSFVNNRVIADSSHQIGIPGYNRLSAFAGALIADSGIFKDCLFSNNTARVLSNRGTGITGAGAASLRFGGSFTGCTFVRNSAVAEVGRASSGAFGGTANFTNCTFANNHLKSGNGTLVRLSDEPESTYFPAESAEGGALYLRGTVQFCTIVSNTLATGTNHYTNFPAPRLLGGGIQSGSELVAIGNSIIAANMGSNLFGTFQDLGGNIISDQPTNFTTASLVMSDPKLGPPRFDSLHYYLPLQADSPAIDFASTADVQSFDQLGLLRNHGVSADSGAIEFRGNELQTFIVNTQGDSPTVHLYQSALTHGQLEQSHDFRSWQFATNPFVISVTNVPIFFRGAAPILKD